MRNTWPIVEVLRLARWAPSGDNGQPWRFSIEGRLRAVVHVGDTSARVLYDYRGRASWLAAGALVETAALAATMTGHRLDWQLLPAKPGDPPGLTLGFDLVPVQGLEMDALALEIEKRSVQRRALSGRPLQDAHRLALEQAAASVPDAEILWLDTLGAKARMAGLLWHNAGIRLTAPEAYATHCKAIEWGQRYSQDRIPDQSLGLDPLALAVMRWAMQRWERVNFLNRYGAGTVLPRIELDWWPALRCAAHFVLLRKRAPTTALDFITSGRSMQRLWLAAEQCGVRLQPEITPLVFYWYHKEGVPVSRDPEVQRRVESLCERMRRMWPDAVLERAVFVGRLGYGPSAGARSLRHELHALQGGAGSAWI